MKKILIVHPSRGRPEQAKKIYDSIVKNMSGENSLTYIVALDDDDPTLDGYKNLFSEKFLSIGESHSSIQAANRVYNKELISQHDMVGIASDDIYFPRNWDAELFKILDQHGYDKIIKTTNQYQGDLVNLNLQIGGFQFFLDYGTFYWPEYISMHADNDMTHFAIKHGRYVEARHLLFPHMQYSLSMPKEILDEYGPMMPFDETYARENRGEAFQHGDATLRKRAREGFPPWRG